MTQPTRGGQAAPWWATARAHALTAAQLYRLAVFPLTRSKLPALPSAHPDGTPCTGDCGQLGHGVHDATAQPTRVREMFAAAPWAAGYGIACGIAPHHLIGIDLDCKNGVDGIRELSSLATRHGFTVPATTTVHTPSGGLHLWLRAPANARVANSASRIAPGIDVRGSGGYLVGPGSLTHHGRYTLAANSTPHKISHVPERLYGLLTASQEPPRQGGAGTPNKATGGDLAGLVQFVRDCGPGDLNNRLFWASCRAFESGADLNDTLTHLLPAAVERGHPETPARRTIASAHRTVRRKEVTRA